MNAHATWLRDNPLFSRLSARALNQLTAHAALFKAPKGSVIYKEGDTSDALYLLVTGRCQSQIRSADGAEHVMQTYSPGDTFGERALLTGDRHWTTVTVITDSALLRINGADVQHLLDRHPPLARQMVRRMNEQFSSLRSEISNTESHAKVGRVTALASVATEDLGPMVMDNLAAALRHITGETVILVSAQAGADTPSLAGWKETGPHAGSNFALASNVREGADKVHRLRLGARGDPAEIEHVASLISHASRHFRHVLIALPSDVPAPIVTSFLHQADLPYIFLRQNPDDLYRANLLVRQVQALPGGANVPLRPILCVDDVERTNPSQTLAGQVGIDVHGYLRGLPRAEEAPHLHYSHSPNDRFSAHIRSLAREICQRRIGLALSSGGAKGLAHIGVLQVLEENNIEVDVVVGASMGAYVGALWCHGLNGRAIEQLALKLDKPFSMLKLTDFSFTPRRGFMKGERVRRMLEASIGHAHFSDLMRTLRVVATDLETLDRVVFDSGEVAAAVQASMAMPGVVVPVTMDGRQLIDGGAADPLPVDVLLEMGVDHIIAVNTIPNPEELKACLLITEEYAKVRKRNILPPVLDKYLNYFSRGNILDTFTRSMHAAETRVAESSCKKADVVLRAISCDGKWHDFRSPRKYIAIGRRVAELHLEELRALVRVKP